MLVDNVGKNDRLEKARNAFERVMGLVKKGAYCDVTLKMEDGKIVFLTILTKEKP